MLLTISTTHYPAGDLGYLLHKHPDKLQTIKLSVGNAHIYYPESSDEKTTLALLLDVDPIDLVKNVKNTSLKEFSLGQYVNDRPYVSSSFISVALAKVFSTALNGNCSGKPELVDTKMPYEVNIAVVSAPKGGEQLIRRLFEPLGYEVNLTRHILDEKFEDWGESKYYTLNLKNTITTKELLSHLYVLLPALDNDKHYYVSEDEIEKLLKKGEGWLNEHPEKEQIVRRYLKNLKSYTKEAMSRLDVEVSSENNILDELPEAELKKKESLHIRRLKTVLEQAKLSGGKSILDLGCGEGKLLKMLLKNSQFNKILGMDVSYKELLRAKENMYYDEMSPTQKDRMKLIHGSLTYRDARLEGYDIATIVEVIEHMDLNRLSAFERVVFEFAKPKTVILTTPNSEFNEKFESMEAGTMRHTDHRFEWTREEFKKWATDVAGKYNYSLEIQQVGDIDEKLGGQTQMGVFKYEN